MKTKEQVIKEAWGDIYNDQIDKNGWRTVGFNYEYNHNDFDTIRYLDCVQIRPKSLQGIENNNGWIPLKGIEEEIEYDEAIWIINKSGCSEYFEQGEYIPVGYAIMWQPAKEPKLPLHK